MDSTKPVLKIKGKYIKRSFTNAGVTYIVGEHGATEAGYSFEAMSADGSASIWYSARDHDDFLRKTDPIAD